VTVTANPYGQGLLKIGSGAIIFGPPADTFKVALLTSSYTPNIDTHTFLSDVTSNEVAAGGGYTSGGVTLTGVAYTYDSTNNRSVLAADDAVWASATFTTRYAVVYKSTGTASTSPLLSYVDFGANQSPSAETFTIAWANGIWRATLVTS